MRDSKNNTTFPFHNAMAALKNPMHDKIKFPANPPPPVPLMLVCVARNAVFENKFEAAGFIVSHENTRRVSPIILLCGRSVV